MRKKLSKLILMGIFLGFTMSAQASQIAQYPWAETLKKIMTSLDGPVAWACAGIAVVLSGLAMAFLDLQGGARKFVQAALGISIAFGVSAILSTMFTFSGAVIW